jgi:hypothetical protein
MYEPHDSPRYAYPSKSNISRAKKNSLQEHATRALQMSQWVVEKLRIEKLPFSRHEAGEDKVHGLAIKLYKTGGTLGGSFSILARFFSVGKDLSSRV